MHVNRISLKTQPDQINRFASSLREIRSSVMTEQPSGIKTVEESINVPVKQLEALSSAGSNTDQGPQQVATQETGEQIGADLVVTEAEAAQHGSKRPKESKHGHYGNQQQAKKQKKRVDLVDTEDDLKDAEYYYDNGMQPQMKEDKGAIAKRNKHG